MMNIKSAFLFSLALFVISSLLSTWIITESKYYLSDTIEVESFSPVYPVLVGKDFNPLYRINVKASAESSLDMLSLDLTNTSLISDINKIQVFYTGANFQFESDLLFAETSILENSLKLDGSQKLEIGENYFWLSIKLEKEVDLMHEVSAVVNGIRIDGEVVGLIEARDHKPKRLGHALRMHMDDGIDTYRIPGLVSTNNGTLIAVYDNRKNSSVDLQEDIDVGMNRSIDGGQTWSKMRVIMDMGEWGGLSEEENGIGDPSILVDRKTNTIWVAGIWAHGHPGKRNWWASKPGLSPEQTSQLILVKSEDDGLTWSKPINITSQIKKAEWYLLLQGPGKGITLDDGTLVFPAQFKDKDQMPYSTIIYSKDHGVSWEIGTGAKSNTTESQIVQLDDGSLMLNMRDNRGSIAGEAKGEGARSVYTSRDLGQSWNVHPTSMKALPEPVCMASLIKHEDILLFSNPNDYNSRVKMTIKASIDEGMTWPEEHQLLLDEGGGRGYSCLTSINKKTIGILYEGSQSDLVFQKVNISDLGLSKIEKK